MRHRGAPDDLRVIARADIVHASRHALVLADGSEIPLHRVIEVRVLGDRAWPDPVGELDSI